MEKEKLDVTSKPYYVVSYNKEKKVQCNSFFKTEAEAWKWAEDTMASNPSITTSVVSSISPIGELTKVSPPLKKTVFNEPKTPQKQPVTFIMDEEDDCDYAHASRDDRTGW